MNQLGDQEAQILAYSQAVKKLEAQLVTFQKQQLSLNEKLTFQANEIYEKEEKLKRYRRIGMKHDAQWHITVNNDQLEWILKKKECGICQTQKEEEPEAQVRKREEQVEDISPNTLEAAKTLSRVASLKPKSIDKGRRYKRRKETKGKKVVQA
ncbi:hypothetical protein Tco_1273107 [Tanacetum coccineum]